MDDKLKVRDVISISFDGKDAKLTFAAKSVSLTVSSSENLERRAVNATAYEVLWAEVKGDKLELSFLHRDAKGLVSLVKLEGTVRDTGADAAQWCEELMSAAYAGVKRNRRLRVLVNPHGGRGKAPLIYKADVEPIFRAAKCTYDTTQTTHPKHAMQIAKELQLDYDAVVLLSGDGLVHEVLSGFGEHEQSANAFSIPIAPIPTGSGNGLSLNLLGLKDGFNVKIATLNAIKGLPMKTDLCSLTQGEIRIYSFMTQAMGLMAEVDTGTESLRWMGDSRFIVGFLQGLVKFKPCPVTLSIKVVEQDKDKMCETLRSSRGPRTVEPVTSTSTVDSVGHDAASRPLMKQPVYPSTGDGWITFDKPVLYVYAGKGPYVGRDLMQFPVSLPSDGLVDVVVQELTSRSELISAMDGAERGEAYWLESQHYFKASAYRVTPQADKGALAVDGESYPFLPFEVEVHPSLATFLSPTGTYASNFEFGSKKSAGEKKHEKQQTSKLRSIISCCLP